MTWSTREHSSHLRSFIRCNLQRGRTRNGDQRGEYFAKKWKMSIARQPLEAPFDDDIHVEEKTATENWSPVLDK